MELVDDRHKDIWINNVRLNRPHRAVTQQLELLLTPPMVMKQSGSSLFERSSPAINGVVLIQKLPTVNILLYPNSLFSKLLAGLFISLKSRYF